jgi:RNA ligase (TIGR02306 family)
MQRKLASVQQIVEVNPIPDADRIEAVKVLGWTVVCIKDRYKPGDKIVYIEVDSIVPDIPVFEFLRKYKFRIRTINMKHTISQGLIMGLEEMGLTFDYDIGHDLTQQLLITKYEEPVPLHLSGVVIGRRPSFVPRTDEYRLQSYPELLQEMGDKRAYVSVKVDGTSSSVYYNPILDEPFGVCSRNLNIKRDENNGHWKVALRHDLENKMKHTVSQGGFVIQGELAGPGIQKNRMELKELELFVFDIFDIATHNYLSVHDMQQICATFGLKTVDIIGYGGFQDMTVDDWIEYAEGDYSGTSNPREGIVVRACEPIRTETLDGHRLGFKVLNNQYLLKEV